MSTTSAIARSVFADLMALPPEPRRQFMRELPGKDRAQLLRAALAEAGTPLAMYVDDPVGFVEDVLDETLWSKSREVLRSVAEHKVTAVPSCFGSSKTWGAARIALWWTMVHAPGTALTVTMAPLWRQVVRQMWPEIRRAHSRANLPGAADTFQMKQRTVDGIDVVTAYGLVANKHDESATQGVHSPHLLVVIDEAGGIPANVGANFRAILTGDDSRLLAIGNPPTDDEGSWFERLCNGEVKLRDVNVIPISAYSTPDLSGEPAPRCKSCPAGVPAHTMATHLVDREWVEDTIAEFGEESPYVQAKVYARFPKGGADRALPYSWVEMARDALTPDDDDYVSLRVLGFADDEPNPDEKVRMGSWIRLGVDVAAGGGDELVVARAAGDLITIRHTSSGPTNSDAAVVAGKILGEIKRATELAKAVDSPFPVRVKIDAIGVGWGVAGFLEDAGRRGLHEAEIVKIIVSEATNREPDPKATFRPRIKRDEMWLAMRELLPRPHEAQPAADEDAPPPPRVRLRVDNKTIAQLTSPGISTRASDSATVVESKDSMKARGLSSPDRGEAVLLSVYEPAPPLLKRRKAKIIVG
jgi:hypothetical protein